MRSSTDFQLVDSFQVTSCTTSKRNELKKLSLDRYEFKFRNGSEGAFA